MSVPAFDVADWSVVPGPVAIRPPFTSVALRDIVLHSPEAAARAALSVPGASACAGTDAEWWDWTCTWTSGAAAITLQMTLFETDPPTWGGFTLDGDASAADLQRLYRLLSEKLPQCWLHNGESELHTAESFREAFLA